jgi:hypothetical protein
LRLADRFLRGWWGPRPDPPAAPPRVGGRVGDAFGGSAPEPRPFAARNTSASVIRRTPQTGEGEPKR